jgi:hypothetical protein
MKIKTKAKTKNGILKAIILGHFIIDEEDIIFYQRDAIKMILDNFIVIPKPDNIFNLKE